MEMVTLPGYQSDIHHTFCQKCNLIDNSVNDKLLFRRSAFFKMAANQLGCIRLLTLFRLRGHDYILTPATLVDCN